MSGVLDHEMSRHDLNALSHRLGQVRSSATDQATRELAEALLAYVEGERPRIVEPEPGRMQCALKGVRGCARGIFTRWRLRVFLIFALVAGGIYAVLDMALLAFLATAPSSGATEFLRSLVSPGELAALGDKIWFSVRAVLEGSVGLAMLAGGVLIVLHREWRGLAMAIAALIVDLTVVNLLVFYQDQFKAVIGIALEYLVLVAAFAYRRIYLEDEAEQAAQASFVAEATVAHALRQAALESGMIPQEAS
jgi:hypothetical protein